MNKFLNWWESYWFYRHKHSSNLIGGSTRSHRTFRWNKLFYVVIIAVTTLNFILIMLHITK
jgi:hypothetical protein